MADISSFSSKSPAKKAPNVSGGWILMILSGLIAVVIFFVLTAKGSDQVKVLVATKDIAPGQKVDSSFFRSVPVSVEQSQLDRLIAVQSQSTYDGYVAVAPISQNDLVPKTALQPAAAASGLRALNIAIDKSHAMGGNLRPGDRVDIASETTATIVATNIEVLSAASSGGGGIASSGANFALTVAVDQEQAGVISGLLKDGSWTSSDLRAPPPSPSLSQVPPPRAHYAMIVEHDTEVPEIAIVRSSRSWARTLHRYVVDHGGAVVKARPLEERQAIEEEYDILVVDDISSFLTNHIIDELHRRGRRVLGVFDPEEFSVNEENSGKQRLSRMGVDGFIEAQAAPEEFVRAIEELVPDRARRLSHLGTLEPVSEPLDALQEPGAAQSTGYAPPRRVAQNEVRRGHITAVLGASGGCGVSEIAIELGRGLAKRGEKTVIVDGDELAPSMAQRLNLPLHPNLRTAVDVVEHSTGRLSECLVGIAGNLEILTGLPHPKDWVEMRSSDMEGLLGELSRGRPQLVVNASPLIEDLTVLGGTDRFGISRASVSTADTLIVVCPPTPMGVARLLDRVADLSALADGKPVHVVVSRTQKGTFKRNEIEREIQRSISATSVHFVPDDSHVERAAWEGTLVPSGEFTKAVSNLVALIPKVPASFGMRNKRAGRAS